MLDLEFAELTDPGLTRGHNEDFIGHCLPESPAQVQSRGWLFALADGVGGQERGEVASRLAVETALAGFRKIPKGVMHVSLLPRLVQEANQAVFDALHDDAGPIPDPGSGRMATTLVLCALRFDSAVISHVGDSRCYLFRGGALSSLTRDHTMVDEQVRLGLISRAEAATHANRHMLTRSLGGEMFVAADTLTVNIQPGDLLLLSSDGLHGYVDDASIQRILTTTPDLAAATAALIAAANSAGGHDNVSAQLIRIRTVERMGLYRGRPYRLL
ncbi:MAG TPA: protein phosphatase 2C domain-containing protein [Acidobacteriaceae bacterium]|nr:protein phosphatase 2C domain-containing protein [Acidobacteriaceae bacterium]